MAEWIKKRIKLQEFMGLMKDQVALGRAMAKQGQLSQINLVILRATSHEEHITEEETIKSVLEVGGGSRMRVSHCIRLIMDRLNKTHSWIVALKCLLLIHRCLHEGGFMLQDQLSIHPSYGGRNYLNLSKFKDTSSPFTWAVSAWIRWYARFIEQWIQTSRNIGFFLDIKEEDKFLHAENLMSLANSQLVKDIISLDDFVREASEWLAEEFVMDHVLVKEGLRLAKVTTVKVYTELKLRFQEVTERISTLARKEALELLHVCERLSKDTMMLTHLFETGEELHAQHDYAIAGQVVYTDYEMIKLKEALRLASLHNVSISPGQACNNNDDCLQPSWKSMRWEKSTMRSLGSGDTRRGKSLSDFNLYETLL